MIELFFALGIVAVWLLVRCTVQLANIHAAVTTRAAAGDAGRRHQELMTILALAAAVNDPWRSDELRRHKRDWQRLRGAAFDARARALRATVSGDSADGQEADDAAADFDAQARAVQLEIAKLAPFSADSLAIAISNVEEVRRACRANGS